MVYFLVCAHRLFVSANREFSFDQFILIAESLKLQLFLATQFFFLHQALLVVVEYVYSLIQFVIAWSFVNKVLTIARKRKLQQVMAIMMLIIFVTLMIYSLLMVFKYADFTCRDTFLGEEWTFFLSFSIFQSLIIIGSSLYLTRIQRSTGIVSHDEI
jgi:hypothetical protein